MQRDLRSIRDYEPRNVCGVVAAVVAGVATVGAAGVMAYGANKEIGRAHV